MNKQKPDGSSNQDCTTFMDMSCNTEEVKETSKSKIRLVRLKIKEGTTKNEYQ